MFAGDGIEVPRVTLSESKAADPGGSAIIRCTLEKGVCGSEMDGTGGVKHEGPSPADPGGAVVTLTAGRE